MKKIRKTMGFTMLSLLLVALLAVQAFAVETDSVGTGGELKYTNTFVSGSNIDQFGAITQGALPCVGNPKVLVFYTTFSGGAPNWPCDAKQVEEFFFGQQNSLRSYYKTSSYGKVDITGTVYEYTTKHDTSYYTGFDQVLDEIIAHYGSSINWSDYDTNNDGYIDGVYLVARTKHSWGGPNFVTSYSADVTNKKICQACFMDAYDLSTLAHETCHMFGPADMYANVGLNPGGIMVDCIMDGANDGDLPGITKYVLGWMDDTKFISGTGSFEVTLESSSTHGDLAVIYPNGDPTNPNWIVVEYITAEANNSRSGVRLWRTNMNLDEFHNIKGSTEFCDGMPASPYEYLESIHPKDVRNYSLKAGDAITPYTYPSTAYAQSYYLVGGAKFMDNLAYSGISIYVNSVDEHSAKLTIQIDNSTANAPAGKAVYISGDATSEFINDNTRALLGTLQAENELTMPENLQLEDPKSGTKIPLTVKMSEDLTQLQMYVDAQYLPQLEENRAYNLDLANLVKTYWGGELSIENFNGTVTRKQIPYPMWNVSRQWISYSPGLGNNYDYFRLDDTHVWFLRYEDSCLQKCTLDLTANTLSTKNLTYTGNKTLELGRVIPMGDDRYLAMFHQIGYHKISYIAVYDAQGNLVDDLVVEGTLDYMGIHDSAVFDDESQNVRLEFFMEGNQLKSKQLPGLKGQYWKRNIYKINEDVFAVVQDDYQDDYLEIVNIKTGKVLYKQTFDFDSISGYFPVDVVCHEGKVYVLAMEKDLELITLDANGSLLKKETILRKHGIEFAEQVRLGITDTGYWVKFDGVSSINTIGYSSTFVLTFDWQGQLQNYFRYGDQTFRYCGKVVWLHDETFFLGTEDYEYLVVDNGGVSGKHTHTFTVSEETVPAESLRYLLHTCGCGYSRKDQFKLVGHIWQDATCTEPSICTDCGITYGSPLGHTWQAATCTLPKTCAVCGETTGDSLGHNWLNATCVAPKTCMDCGATTGSVSGHSWVDATCTTPKKCKTCGTTSGGVVHTYESKYDYKCDLCGTTRPVDMTRPMVDMFRMYDPNSGEHFYTGSTVERQNLIDAGWNYEGVGFTFPLTTGDPVHRLYDPITGEHLYTMDVTEMNMLLAAGWNYEGIAFNSGFENEVPQYRLHNPNATRGAYHFTASLEERNTLISLGWEYQGIGWYSLGA